LIVPVVEGLDDAGAALDAIFEGGEDAPLDAAFGAGEEAALEAGAEALFEAGTLAGLVAGALAALLAGAGAGAAATAKLFTRAPAAPIDELESVGAAAGAEAGDWIAAAGAVVGATTSGVAGEDLCCCAA
jgi:hypothetical protein